MAQQRRKKFKERNLLSNQIVDERAIPVNDPKKQKVKADTKTPQGAASRRRATLKKIGAKPQVPNFANSPSPELQRQNLNLRNQAFTGPGGGDPLSEKLKPLTADATGVVDKRNSKLKHKIPDSVLVEKSPVTLRDKYADRRTGEKLTQKQAVGRGYQERATANVVDDTPAKKATAFETDLDAKGNRINSNSAPRTVKQPGAAKPTVDTIRDRAAANRKVDAAAYEAERAAQNKEWKGYGEEPAKARERAVESGKKVVNDATESVRKRTPTTVRKAAGSAGGAVGDAVEAGAQTASEMKHKVAELYEQRKTAAKGQLAWIDNSINKLKNKIGVESMQAPETEAPSQNKASAPAEEPRTPRANKGSGNKSLWQKTKNVPGSAVKGAAKQGLRSLPFVGAAYGAYDALTAPMEDLASNPNESPGAVALKALEGPILPVIAGARMAGNRWAENARINPAQANVAELDQKIRQDIEAKYAPELEGLVGADYLNKTRELKDIYLAEHPEISTDLANRKNVVGSIRGLPPVGTEQQIAGPPASLAAPGAQNMQTIQKPDGSVQHISAPQGVNATTGANGEATFSNTNVPQQNVVQTKGEGAFNPRQALNRMQQQRFMDDLFKTNSTQNQYARQSMRDQAGILRLQREMAEKQAASMPGAYERRLNERNMRVRGRSIASDKHRTKSQRQQALAALTGGGNANMQMPSGVTGVAPPVPGGGDNSADKRANFNHMMEALELANSNDPEKRRIGNMQMQLLSPGVQEMQTFADMNRNVERGLMGYINPGNWGSQQDDIMANPGVLRNAHRVNSFFGGNQIDLGGGHVIDMNDLDQVQQAWARRNIPGG